MQQIKWCMIGLKVEAVKSVIDVIYLLVQLLEVSDAIFMMPTLLISHGIQPPIIICSKLDIISSLVAWGTKGIIGVVTRFGNILLSYNTTGSSSFSISTLIVPWSIHLLKIDYVQYKVINLTCLFEAFLLVHPLNLPQRTQASWRLRWHRAVYSRWASVPSLYGSSLWRPLPYLSSSIVAPSLL